MSVYRISKFIRISTARMSCFHCNKKSELMLMRRATASV